MKNYVLNFILAVLPNTRFFNVKRFILNFFGYKIEHDVKINSELKIYGNGCVDIKNGTWLGNSASMYIPKGSGVYIGKNCDVGPLVVFQCGSHKIGNTDRRAGDGSCEDIYIGDGTWIGVRVTILPGVIVGRSCMVAAGALVVSGEYPDNCMIAGVPAKIVKVYRNE